LEEQSLDFLFVVFSRLTSGGIAFSKPIEVDGKFFVRLGLNVE